MRQWCSPAGRSTRPPACFSRRERSPFTLIATAATLAAGARNPMSDVLGSDVMWRRAITPGEGFSLGGGTNAELSSCREKPRSTLRATTMRLQAKAPPTSASRFQPARKARLRARRGFLHARHDRACSKARAARKPRRVRRECRRESEVLSGDNGTAHPCEFRPPSPPDHGRVTDDTPGLSLVHRQ